MSAIETESEVPSVCVKMPKSASCFIIIIIIVNKHQLCINVDFQCFSQLIRRQQ